MAYSVWCGLPTAELEVLKRGMSIRRDTLDAALFETIQIEDAGQMIVFEIEGDDGSRLNRGEVENMVWRERARLTAEPPIKY